MSPRTPLFKPSAYFRRFDRPSLPVAAGIVTLLSVLTVALMWWFVSRVLEQVGVSGSVRSEVMSELGGQFVLVFLSMFVGWLLYSGVVHLFVWFAGGEAGFSMTLAIIGESMLVSLVTFPLVVVGFQVLVGQVPGTQEAAIAFIERRMGRDTGILLVVSLVRTLWEATITTIGLAERHDIDVLKIALVTFGLGLLGLAL